jgi:hypothetical protein
LLAALPGATFAQIQMFPPVTYQTPSSPDGIASGDFDRDGHQDLAVAAVSPDRIVILRNYFNGTFVVPPRVVSLPAGSAPNFVRAVDIDGDGDIDLVVVEQAAKKIQILLNDGAGNFTLGPSFNTGNNPRWLITRPLRQGNAIDMAVLNRADGTMTVYLNNGGLQFTSNTIAVGSDPRCIASADITGDGRPELFVTSYAEHKVTILTNDGTGHFAAAAPLMLDTTLSPNGIIAADFNGDTVADLAIASVNTSNQGVVSVYRRSGTTYTGPTNYSTLGLGAGQIASADLDRDGHLDLVTVNPDSGNLSIFTNTGSGAFGTAELVTVGTGPRVMTIADFDGDYIMDIAVTNLGSGTVSVLINALPSPPCYANCDNSTVQPILNVNDFECFMTAFTLGYASIANCDHSTVPPVLNIADFECFVNAFAAGCS